MDEASMPRDLDVARFSAPPGIEPDDHGHYLASAIHLARSKQVSHCYCPVSHIKNARRRDLTAAVLLACMVDDLPLIPMTASSTLSHLVTMRI
jgi:hypothetical protein